MSPRPRLVPDHDPIPEPEGVGPWWIVARRYETDSKFGRIRRLYFWSGDVEGWSESYAQPYRDLAVAETSAFFASCLGAKYDFLGEIHILERGQLEALLGCKLPKKVFGVGE